MTYQKIGSITWKSVYSSSVYLYGSRILFDQQHVYLKNPQMPTSKPLVEWSSVYNYQGNRRSPELPLLVPERNYHLIMNLASIPAKRFYLRIDFKNQQNEIIESHIQRELEDDFQCPKEMFTYTITIFGAGCQSLVFTSLKLFDKDPIIPLRLHPVAAKGYDDNNLPDFLQLVAPLINNQDEKG